MIIYIYIYIYIFIREYIASLYIEISAQLSSMRHELIFVFEILKITLLKLSETM